MGIKFILILFVAIFVGFGCAFIPVGTVAKAIISFVVCALLTILILQ